MFIKLTHGLHNVINAIVSYIQKWTDDTVPDGTRTVHNFKDGLGKRPAVPLDELSSGTKIESVKIGENFDAGDDEFTVSNNVYTVKLHTELGHGRDDLGFKIGINSVACDPNPIVFTIQNDVPDKIEKIVPVKTQALPGQDYIFEIFYVKDYSYIDGDILPVFGSWGRYARISSNGRYLTVNSDADLTVRLVLTPTPQDWIPEHPDEGAIQEPGDRQLNTIPRDGARYDYTIEESKLQDNFYVINIENQASTFVINGELSNGKQHLVYTPNDKYTIPMVFSEGFDEKAIYWKCYDDPKGLTPVQGYYIQKDFNADFEPIPDPIYRKAQYIYSNGYCYIDTGYKLKAGDKVKILASINEYSDSQYIPIFGCRTSTSYGSSTSGAYNAFVRFQGYRTLCFERNNQIRWNPTYTTRDYGLIHSDVGNPFMFVSDGKSFESQSIDGTTKIRQEVAAEHDTDTTLNCYLFTVNQNGSPYGYGIRGYFYRVEIFDKEDNIIMRLIPAYNTVAKIYGMYDLVSNKFFANKRSMQSFSGALFYVWQQPIQCSNHNTDIYLTNDDDIDYTKEYDSLIPPEYQRIWAVYSKESRLDTGYKIKSDDRVECIATVDNNTGSNYRVLFGARQSSFSDDNYFFFTRFNSSNIACYGKNAQETRATTMTYGVPCKFIAEPNRLSCYSKTGTLNWKIDVTGTAVDCRYNCWIGCGNNNNSVDSWCYAKYHSFKIFDKDNNLVMNLVPVKRKSDGVIGFYDMVAETFMTRTSGNYAYEAINIDVRSKRILHLENIHSDLSLGFIKNPVYDNPFKLEDCIEDEHEHVPMDSVEYSYEWLNSSLEDYFWVVNNVNNVSDYASFNTSYNTVRCGDDTSFILTYKEGYDNYDITCTANKGANVEVGKTHYITYNELDVPADYTVIPGLYTNNSNTYFKTGYIPKWNDRVECYCSITRDSYYTYPSYVFGARNGVNNKSFVFYAHRSAYDNWYRMGYDRCCSETDIREIINNELLKITADNNGCECDFAYTKTKINTEMYQIPHVPDYNQDVTLPDTYEKLGYIENTSSIYADLGFKLNRLDKVEIICNINSNNDGQYKCLFGGRQNYNPVTNCYGFWIRVDYTNKPSYSRTVGTAGTDFVYNKDIKLITDSTSAAWYNITTGEKYNEIIVPEATQNCNYNCYLFVMNNSGSLHDGYAKGRISSFKVYNENNELIQYFVPARRKSDNIAGLYNVITNTFITGRNGNFSWSRINYQDYPDCDYEMYIFGCNNANSRQYGYYGNMYKFTIYNGDNQSVVNLIPVKRNSDNVLGFYDTVRQMFITPAGGAVSQVAVPTYKGYVKITNITDDTTVTMVKNNSNRKELVLEQNEDTVEYGYDWLNASVKDYFWYVKYNNSAPNVCSLYAPISTYYNTVNLPNTTTRFPITYKIGRDHTDIEATSNNQAVIEIGEAMHIVYEQVPDEYFIIPGLYSNDSNTYFEIEYKPKAYDKVTCYANIGSDNYTYYLFGVNDGEGRNSCVFCTRYTYDNSYFYFDRCKRVNCATLIKNEIIKIEGDYTQISYTNGYDTYTYSMGEITPTDCTRNLYVFGCNWNGSRQASIYNTTIYKFTMSDEYGVSLNLIPVKRKIDNALGFYDTVGDKFYLPAGGSVTEAPVPQMKGGIYVSNITEDTEITITEKQKQHIEIGNDIEYAYNIEKTTLEDYWFWLNINNLAAGKITFNNQTYANYYTCKNHDNIDMSVSYAAGYDNNSFIVSEGQLTNAAWKLTNVTADKNLTIMLNDYHDPVCLSEDDLGIFTNTDFGNYNQYIIIEGNDTILSKYTLINSQPSNMIQRDIYEFNTDNIDLIGWDPNNTPGEIQSKNVSSDGNIDEVITNITVDGVQLYKHVFTLRNQIKLEVGKQYIFKVRNSQDSRMIIACAKDTTSRNLVNSNNEMYTVDDKLYFGWNESNKYIVTGNMSIYFEINGVKQ